ARGRVSCIRLWWILAAVLVLLLGVRLAQGQSVAVPETDAAAEDLPPAVRRIVVRRMVVDRFEGHVRAGIPRAGVIAAVEQEETVDLVRMRALEAQQQLVDGSPEGYVEVAKTLHVVAILRGFVGREAAGYRAIITVIDGTDGRRSGKFEYSAATLMKLRTLLKESLLSDLLPLLEQKRPPEIGQVPPVANEGSSPQPEPEARKLEPRPPSVEQQRPTA